MHLGWICVLLGSSLNSQGQDFTVTGQVDLVSEGSPNSTKGDRSNVVVWLTALDDRPGLHSVSEETPAHPPRLVQKDKRFSPHVVVVPAGTAVEFPNHDPFFHNVFSLFEGKRFDLGLYEAGTTRMVRFDRAGVSYIFCNIHPEMSAVVVVLASPYFATPNKQGDFSIPSVSPGRYILHVWNENALPATLQALSREVMITEASRSLGLIHVRVTLVTSSPHKNKYGQDYEPPSPNNPVYVQP
jgi:plastocyanin